MKADLWVQPWLPVTDVVAFSLLWHPLCLEAVILHVDFKSV